MPQGIARPVFLSFGACMPHTTLHSHTLRRRPPSAMLRLRVLSDVVALVCRVVAAGVGR
jgi:hypothetical protein